MFSKIMSLKLQKSILDIVSHAPILTIYTPKQPIVEICPLWDLKQEAQAKRGFKQRAKYCKLFSGKSWDFYQHINKQGCLHQPI